MTIDPAMWILLILVSVVILIPLLVYLSVKMGTMGYYRGRRLFEELEKQEKKDG